ncbi:MAG TPA: intradiol ring-cleavage dioxygenase [Actinomycetes bacterium]|nr:intradiol ring-cleavage dioxygenase [Actinomycetes bacterium]
MTTRGDQPPTDTRRWLDEDGNEIDETDRGLVYDLRTLVDRRRVLGLFGGVSAAALLAACGGGSGGSGQGSTATTAASGATTTTAGSVSSGGDLSEVPEETGGPFPGDGSNGPNVLDDSGVVRGDIRSSFGSSTTTAEGVPLAIRLTVRDAASGDAVEGAGVYLWHCDRDGNYSLYSQGVTGENYLRGAQEADANGAVTFTSIFPACYSGRWPHIHFEVYASLADATSSGPIVKTSQIALPKEACEAVYATPGYEQSVANLSQVSLAGDNVFGDDGGIHQLATMSGDPTGGYTAALTIGV